MVNSITSDFEDSCSETFLLERYKYILSQKQEANRISFKIGSLFQALLVPLVGLQLFIVREVTSQKLSSMLGRLASQIIFSTSMLISLFCIVMIVGGIISWVKYRDDEAEIELKVFGRKRPSPSLRDIFRWYETYIVLGIVSFQIGYGITLFQIIIPSMRA